MTAKKTSNSKSEQAQIQTIEPGFIAARATVSGGVSGKPDDSDMALINKLSRSGNVDPASIYRFDCVPSTQNVDSYYTRMDVSSLINYAQEAKAGVPIQNSHRTGGYGKTAELPIGRSFNGSVENDPDNAEMQRFIASGYMLRSNMANGSVNTDDIIAGIEAGTVSDISIGFAFGAGTPERNFTDRTMLRCSICGNDFLRSDPWGDGGEDNCNHWPGEMYKTNGGSKSELCVLDVVNAHLSEFSTVYNGATPGAVILKAQRAVGEGLLDRPMIHRLEDTYRVRLMDYATYPVPVIGSNARKDKVMEIVTEPNLEVENPIEVERTDTDMVDKRVLEDATKEGAKHALAELAKSMMGSRDFNDDELALFGEVETKLAAGEVDQANGLLLRLMNPQLQVEPETAFFEGEERQEGVGDEENRQQPVLTSDIISLAMTASERQQFTELQEENKRLKKEANRLRPLAEIGERAWTGLISLTVASFVRANLGSGEEIRGMLMQLPFDHVRTLRNQYETIAFQLTGQHDQDEDGNLIYLGEGGRQTVPADANQPSFGQALNVAAQRAGAIKRNDFKAYK
jgi:hypothetical protein